jgi:hypothetical protein
LEDFARSPPPKSDTGPGTILTDYGFKKTNEPEFLGQETALLLSEVGIKSVKALKFYYLKFYFGALAFLGY